MAVAANKLELLQIADAVAREKSIERGIVIAAMKMRSRRPHAPATARRPTCMRKSIRRPASFVSPAI